MMVMIMMIYADSLLMEESADLALVLLNIFAVLFGLGASLYAYRIRNHFKGGLLEKPFKILGQAPLIGAISWVFHSLDIFFDASWVHYIHYVLGAVFFLVLLYGFYELDHAWIRLSKPATVASK